MIAQAIILIILGSQPTSGKIMVEHGGTFQTAEECGFALAALIVEAQKAGLSLDHMAGMCVSTPFRFETGEPV